MIDFHCHVDLFPDPAAIVSETVRRECDVLAVTTTPLAWEGTNRVIGDVPRVCIALGLHPELVAQRYREVREFHLILPAARFVGEIGIDGSARFRNSFDLQRQVFRELLRATADSGGRVMSIHSRDAASSVLDELEDCPEAGTPILHWFSGSQAELLRASDLGCWFSIGPAMLRTQKGRCLLKDMPKERVLTESDGPFAQAKNGKPVFPWELGDAISVLCDIWDLKADQVQEQLRANLLTLISPAKGFE